MLRKNIVAVIPARGNSKRIPGKNYKKFNGEPIIVSTIKKLKEYNFWSIAMDNNSDLTLKELSKNSSLFNENLAIILGNEGKGIRPLVKNNCDTSVRIDISSNINSLNVSATLAIVLYEINRT